MAIITNKLLQPLCSKSMSSHLPSLFVFLSQCWLFLICFFLTPWQNFISSAQKGQCFWSKANKGTIVNEHVRMHFKWKKTFSFPVLLNSSLPTTVIRYRFCGYVLGFLKRSSSFINNRLYYLSISTTCITFSTSLFEHQKLLFRL